jgi:protein involved in polysaccharide export with SLBB domain
MLAASNLVLDRIAKVTGLESACAPDGYHCMTYPLNFRYGAVRICGVLPLLLGLSYPLGVAAQNIPLGSPVDPREAQDDRRDEASREPVNPGEIESPAGQVFEPTALGPASASSEPNIERRAREQDNTLSRNMALRPPPEPGEFERYVSTVADRPIPRFGHNLLLPGSRDFAVPATSTVPPDYTLNVGDTVTLYLTGSVGGTVEREIDTNGNIFLPSVGSIRVAGVRYGDLRSTVVRAIGQEYRVFNVGVSIKSLRGIRVYVTGFANNPGAFTLNSLSTMANAVLQAGGPASGGSFRTVKLYRNGREVGDFDLYTLLRGGNRIGDEVLQNEDVLFIPPAGQQVAVLGSVEQEAIYELKPGESLAEALALAGGGNDLADPDRMILYRTSDTIRRGPIEIPVSDYADYAAKGGDILHVLSRGTLVQPIARQSVLVRVEGEVNNPGDYYVAPNTPLADVMALAGGATARAYVFGSRLERRSVREQQRDSFAEAIRQLEFALASAPLVTSGTVSESRAAAEMASARQVLDLLRQREPDGRVVMSIEANSPALPGELLLEHQDRLVIPPRPTTVGVFGAVYRPASFLIEDRPLMLREYLERAGGLQRAGDSRRIFVVRANGDVLTRKNGMMKARALPGDVVFVPLRTSKTDIWQRIRDITAIVFQLGVTAAAVNSIQ